MTDTRSTDKDAEYIDTQLILMASGMYPSLAKPGEINAAARQSVSLAPAARGLVMTMTAEKKAEFLEQHIRQLTQVLARLNKCKQSLKKGGGAPLAPIK
jgi:hypothetical protein